MQAEGLFLQHGYFNYLLFIVLYRHFRCSKFKFVLFYVYGSIKTVDRSVFA